MMMMNITTDQNKEFSEKLRAYFPDAYMFLVVYVY